MIRGEMMTFTEQEKEFFRTVIKQELEQLKEQGKGVFITEDKPTFLAMEDKYEDFLENLLKKL